MLLTLNMLSECGVDLVMPFIQSIRVYGAMHQTDSVPEMIETVGRVRTILSFLERIE